ncbi:hypothetical protein [Polynucleobacter sp.]|uniref:hypothetical protein n=1 Tax=Polynucleobacter sp. TaxID=2029855 RepID=UPI003F699183
MTEYPIITLPKQQGRKRGRLYYYAGNFFHPLTLTANEPGLIARAIREFKKQHSAMIAADRADAGYRTLEQLCDV